MGRGRGQTVLLVEDAPDLGPLLRETLEEWGYSALLGRSVAEAWACSRRTRCRLVLLDQELPDMSGTERVERLRSEQRAVPPVVLVTAGPRPGEGTRWPEVVQLLRKPFELAELAALLERHLVRR